MAVFSDTSTTTLAYAAEAVFGTAPATGYQLVRFSGESMNISIESAKSEEIDSSRQYTGSVQVSGSASGDLNFQLSYGEYDDFLLAVLQDDAWDAGYSDVVTEIGADNLCTVTSTTGLKVGTIVKLLGLGASGDDGVYTVKKINSSTTFTTEETLTVEAATGTGTATNSGAIQNGVTNHSFAFEKKFVNEGSSHYFLLTGMRCGSMNMSLSTGSVMSGSFAFTGTGGTASEDSAESGSYSAAGANELMNSVSNVDNLTLYSVAADGTTTAMAATFQDFSLTVDNQLREQAAVGSLYAAGIGSSRIMVEASATIYFTNRDLFTQFIVNGDVQLRWQLTDEKDDYGNRYGFCIPQAKVASHEVVASGPDADIVANVSFYAVKDVLSGTTSSILISRIASV